MKICKKTKDVELAAQTNETLILFKNQSLLLVWAITKVIESIHEAFKAKRKAEIQAQIDASIKASQDADKDMVVIKTHCDKKKNRQSW